MRRYNYILIYLRKCVCKVNRRDLKINLINTIKKILHW